MTYMADLRLMFPFERNNRDRTLDNSQLISMAPVVVLNFAFLNFYSTVFFRLTFVPVLIKTTKQVRRIIF